MVILCSLLVRAITNHRVCTDDENTNSQIVQQDQVLQLENGRGLVSIHKVFASPKTLTKGPFRAYNPFLGIGLCAPHMISKNSSFFKS